MGNRSSRASRRNRRRARARLRDLAIHGTLDLACIPQRHGETLGEREARMIRCAVAWARATGQNQWVYRDRLAGHAPKLVSAESRDPGKYGVGVDGSTEHPTRSGHARKILEGRSYRMRDRIADCKTGMAALLPTVADDTAE